MKCHVKDCKNHNHQGLFIGFLCSPCYEFLSTGQGKHSQLYRNTVAAEREACAKVCDEMVAAEYATGKVDHNEMGWTQACAIAIRARMKTNNAEWNEYRGRGTMTDKQPEALRLAECLDEPDYCTILQMRQAAAELRRLHEVNAELVEALTDLVNEIGDGFMPHKLFVDQALAALAKAQGETALQRLNKAAEDNGEEL